MGSGESRKIPKNLSYGQIDNFSYLSLQPKNVRHRCEDDVKSLMSVNLWGQ